MKHLPARKAPGPDGFIAEFLHACWPTIQQDFIDAFWQLYALRGRRFSCLNQALLTLLPKRTDAHGLGDYRPISLIHLVAKVLSLRLAPGSTPLSAQARMRSSRDATCATTLSSCGSLRACLISSVPLACC